MWLQGNFSLLFAGASQEEEMRKQLDLSGKKVCPEDLREFCVEAMLKSGMNEKDSRTAADVLVTTDIFGVHTHGTKQLRNLLKNVRLGGLNAKASPEVVSEGPAWGMIDGHHAMPMVTSCMAMTLAIKKAKDSGIGYVGVRHSSHFGAAGYYANMAAKEDMFGLAMTNVDICVTVTGAKGRVLGTNPLAYASPAGREKPVFLDVATSTVAISKIFAARTLGKTIPDNWLVDENGVPTTDPNKCSVGALVPMAGHKGYGIALMIEILCGVLTGSGVTRQVGVWVEEFDKPANQGHSFIAIDIGVFMPIQQFKDRMDRLIREIKSSPKVDGVDQIYLPGEIEWLKREKALREGIQLPDDVVASLAGLAEDIGLDVIKPK
jgi:ureidoglycolate dehydrogenase (NAD+)